jgi:hypothetical protein
MKVWLDDERMPPDTSWLWVQSVDVAMLHILTGEVEEMSLNHDLGTEKTGYDVIKFIEHLSSDLQTQKYVPAILKCHSADPVRRGRIYAAIKSIKRNMALE